MNNRG